jgi:hypothetical protein
MTLQALEEANMHVYSLRNLCYVNALAELGLLPGMRSAGELCLLPGLSLEERFNIKDWNGEYLWDERSTSLVWRLEISTSLFMKEEQAKLVSELPSNAKMLIEQPSQAPHRSRKLRVVKHGEERSKQIIQPQLQPKHLELMRQRQEMRQKQEQNAYSELMEKRRIAYQSLSKQHQDRIDQLHQSQAKALDQCQRQFNRALFAYHAKDNHVVDHLAANFFCQLTHFGESRAVDEASETLQAYVSSYRLKVRVPDLSHINISSCNAYNMSYHRREEEKTMHMVQSEECRDAILKPFRDHIHPIIKKTADKRPATAFEIPSNSQERSKQKIFLQ